MSSNKNKTPKGKLIAIGGAVDKGTIPKSKNNPDSDLKFFEMGILRRLINEMEGKTNRVEILTTASRIPVEIGVEYIEAFKKLDHNNVGVMHIQEKKDVTNPEYLQRLRDAEAILFSGGNQSHITNVFLGSEALEILKDKYMNENFVFAGTSAGAMAMSTTMISGGSISESMMKGGVKMKPGLGMLDGVTIDTHFVKRGRIGRLCQSVADEPTNIGIGLGEDTGLLITKANHMEAIGSGLVVIVEGDKMRYTNVGTVEKGEPITVENLSLHVLAKGHNYIFDKRRIEK